MVAAGFWKKLKRGVKWINDKQAALDKKTAEKTKSADEWLDTQKKKIKDWLDNRKKAILDKEKKDKENELSATADTEKKIAQKIRSSWCIKPYIKQQKMNKKT